MKKGTTKILERLSNALTPRSLSNRLMASLGLTSLLILSLIFALLIYAAQPALLIIGIGVLIILIIANSFTHPLFKTWVVNPMHQLMVGIEQISGNDLSFRIPITGEDEINQVAVAFNGMADELKRRHQEVLAYTQALEKENIERLRADQSWHMLKKALDTMNVGVTITDAQGKILYTNPADARMHGYTVDELIGKPGNIFASVNHANPPAPEKVKVWSSWQRETLNIRKDGSTFPVQLLSDAISDATGEPLGIVTTCLDVTERQKAEQALQQAKADLEIKVAERTAELQIAIVELETQRNFAMQVMIAMGQGLTVTSPEGPFEFVNPAYARMVGYSPEELIGKNPEDVTVTEDHPTLAQAYTNRLEGKTTSYETRLQCADGRTVDVLITGSPRWQEGHVAGSIAVITDLTEHKRAAERQNILYQVLRAMSDRLDTSTVARSAAEAICKLTNYPHVCIVLPNKNNSQWIVRGAAGHLAAELHTTHPITKGVIGRVFATGKMQIVPDSTIDPDYVREVNNESNTTALRSEIAAPLHHSGRLIGALNIESQRLNAFDTNDILMIQSLAEIVALAIDNAQLHEELSESEARFHAIFERSGVGIALTDLNVSIIESNPALEDYFGYTSEELKKLGFGPVTYPADASIDLELGLELMQGKRSHYHIEKRHVRKDGRLVWGRITVSLVRDLGGAPLYGIAVIQDITERKQAEESLRKLSRVVDQSPDSIVITDLAGNIEYVNPRFTSLTGYTADEAIGKNPRILKSGKTPGNVHRELWTTITAGKVWHGEFMNRKKNGELYYENANIAPIVDEQGHITHFVAIKEDITEQRVAAETIKRQANELKVLYDISLEINAQPDLSTLLQTIITRATRLVNGDHGALHLVDPQGETLRLVVGYNIDIAQIGLTRPIGAGLAGRIAQSGESMIIEDYFHWEGRIPHSPDFDGNRLLGVPLQAKGQIIGAIVIAKLSDSPPFTQEEARLVQLFANQAALAIDRTRLYNQVQQLAVTDELTGIYNRRGLFQFGEREVERALRFHRPLSVIMFDIDYFKRVNDEFSHAVGDHVLHAVAQWGQKNARHLDIVGRYGGEEFVCLLPETDVNTALGVAERLRQLVQNHHVTIQGHEIAVTVSMGVATISSEIFDLSALIDRADQAMLRAKGDGRNCIRVFEVS